MAKFGQHAGKTAIVTGAGKGIGKGIAIHLGLEGARVVVNYAHSREGAEEVVQRIRDHGGEAFSHQADVRNKAAVEEMVRAAADRFGSVDIAVCNAGVDPHKPFLEVDEELFDWVIGTNLKGGFFCAQASAREMVKNQSGRIIFISSIHSIQTYPGMTAYAATKGGINAMTRQLGLELAQYGITVNCIAPGAVHVEKFSEVVPDYDKHMFDHEIPVGFMGMPEDIAAMVSFFASDEARYVTGQVIYADGGSSTRLFLGVTEQPTKQFSDVKTLEQKE
jgi:NAD(P)-dependent dehydrogenase (short-subunit alcohol dehydrogenase family)